MADQITLPRAVVEQALDALGDAMQMLLPKSQSDKARRAAYALRAMLAQAEPVQSNTVLQTFSDIDKGIYTNASFSHANVVMVSKDHYASLLDSAVMQQQAEPAQSEYGSTDCATFAGLPMTDGDKRLSAMLTQAFGTDHPAIHDLVALLFAARGKKQDESVQDEALSAALGWPGGISNPVLDRKSLLQQVAELRTSRSIKEKA